MYASKYYTCEQIDERLLQGYYDDAVAAGYEGTKEEFLEELNRLLQNPRINADLVDILPGTGLTSVNAQQAFAEIAKEIYPVQVAIASSNAGTYEVGDAQHSVTPQIVLSITRNGADVSASATTTSSQGTVQPDHKTIIGSALTNGTTTFQISVSQGGQTRSVPNQVFDFMNYMYYGEVSTKPASATAVATLCENGTLSKQLSRATTKSSTNLPANKYYVFAVKGSVNLVCRHAGTDGIVTGCTTGTATIQRVNNSGSDSYSYIIVEKSASAWSFKITNS